MTSTRSVPSVPTAPLPLGDRVADPATDPSRPPWRALTQGRGRRSDPGLVRTGRVLLQVGIVGALVIAMVAGGSVVLARQIAEREAVNAAAQVTDLLAESVVQVALEDRLLAEPVAAAAARARLHTVVRQRVLKASGVVRMKLWSSRGVIVYSDEPRLVGRKYVLEQRKRDVLLDPRTEAR